MGRDMGETKQGREEDHSILSPHDGKRRPTLCRPFLSAMPISSILSLEVECEGAVN